jgi:hypothetical protein
MKNYVKFAKQLQPTERNIILEAKVLKKSQEEDNHGK